MKEIHNMIQPKAFYSDVQYLYLEDTGSPETNTQPVVLSPVEFVAYDVCPAFVIVRNGSGKRWRCPRHELYMFRNPT